MFFCHPPAVAFWFLVRETGGFLKGWPRFIPVCRSTFEPAGGTVEAQSVMVTAPPVLCCMGDRLGIPMNFFFFFFFVSVSPLISRLLSYFIFIQIFVLPYFLIAPFASLSTCFCPSLFLFSEGLSHFLSASLPRCLCRCLSWGLSAAVAAGLSCAVICHTTEGEETSFIDAAPFSLSLPLIFVSHRFRPFGFCPLYNCCPGCSHAHRAYFSLNSPFGQFSRRVHIPKMSSSHPTCATFQ